MWNPPSDMLLYVEPQDIDRFKSAVVQAAANSAYIAPENLEYPGHTVGVGESRNFSPKPLAHPMLHILSSEEAAFKQWRDVFSLLYYRGIDAVNDMKNLEGLSKKGEVAHLGFYGQKGSLLNEWQAFTMRHILCVPSEGSFLLRLANFEKLLCLVSGVSILAPILPSQKLKPSLRRSLKRQ